MSEEIKDNVKQDETEKVETEKVESEGKTTKKEKKDKYKEQIAKLEEELKIQKNEYLKVFAEMENTKRRIKEEQIKDRKYASQKVISELINPIDMLVKIVEFGSPNPEIQNYLFGFKMITDQLVNILQAEGLSEVKALNQQFDPKTMDAMAIVENDELEDDTVVEVKQAGYMYKDRLIRPAMVVVSKKKKVETNENIIEESKEEN